MSENDSLQRFIFEQLAVRGEYIKLERSYKTIVHQHNYPAPIKKLLGEALAVAGLLSAIIKFDGRLTVQFRGTGKLKLLIAQSDNDFHLRGLVKWDGELSYDDLMAAFKDGVLVITLDTGDNKNRYQGIVPWRGNSLTDSIEGYFRDSEQLATRVWLGVDDDKAVGFLLQIIPKTGNEKDVPDEDSVEKQWHYVISQAENLKLQDLFDLDYKALLNSTFPRDDIRIFNSVPVSFQCTCSRKSGADAIRILGEKEAEEELKDHHSIVVTCDFCNREYVYDRADVKKIFEEEKRPPSSKLH